MDVHLHVDEGLGHSSYLVELGDGRAALVDPARFPNELETIAAARRLAIVWTIDTHSHADYVTGSPGVARRHGATFLAPGASRLATPHRPLGDGDRVDLAPGVSLTAIATPGHTPDHHAYLLTAGAEPVALFTGGSLMVGAVGRTDLCGPDLAAPLARAMHRGLRRFDGLPDDLPVYPTHGAGSFCAAPGGTARTSTLGTERATNPMLQFDDEDAFVAAALKGLGTFPSYFARLPEVNRVGPAHYDSVPTPATLGPGEVAARIARGALVVDARPIDAFARGHVPGARSNALRPAFATWIGWLVDPSREIILVLGDDQDPAVAARACLDVGHERIAGVLAGGIDAWVASRRPLARIPLVEPTGIRADVVDVRQADEFAAGHVPGARNVELGAIASTVLPRIPITVMCGHGERAMTAASILAARGHDVDVLAGGPDAWQAATGRDLTTGR